MSAILSADDLNDFISPGVACIKPIETLPEKADGSNPYEVTTEDKAAASNPPPASISLTDCLACSGCVTSAEAVLVSLQSHNEVLNTLDAHPPLQLPWAPHAYQNGATNSTYGDSDAGVEGLDDGTSRGKLFVASVSPQVRASIASTYNISEGEAGNMISHLLSGPTGLRSGGVHGNGFTWIIDTNILRSAALVAAAEEVSSALANPSTAAVGAEGSIHTKPKKPILTSACPGWICYAEKTHPHVLPHLSRLKSPQALTGTLIKSVLAQRYGIPPSSVWHLALMPCFDKKLEASRAELTSSSWLSSTSSSAESEAGIRDTDCVITARELLHLASARDIDFGSLPRTPLPSPSRIPFPDPLLDTFLFPRRDRRNRHPNGDPDGGPSGGYLWHILQTYQAAHPGSSIKIERGRNADVVDYLLLSSTGAVILRMARYYGFRNIQNLVRRLKPAKGSRMPGARAGVGARRANGAAGKEEEYSYVEVMACPGIKVQEVAEIRGLEVVSTEDGSVGQPVKLGPKEQREWLRRVDEAYFSAESESDGEGNEETDGEEVDAMDIDQANGSGNVVNGIDTEYTLLFTSYRKVESDVGKKVGDVERVAGLASSIGGGW
ncbi:Cytosolic Fe-S cluster assembly factor nar1 [Coniosporium tulheliwenetii]|uniref:Cytosolic Fe-S cluster assembly factor nar1 n=1 Tax=Coniosporium tulheliwenetii TaxID=3383036 RepID=A0ACC2ZKB2_9PEZI|nr:Cytosolic Fe-S cluster assembly factor nar1 [Cladosporium sp. JES 115]